MTPQALADLHARCFRVPRPYSAGEFQAFLDDDACFFNLAGDGFALGRVVADEAELLTIAVDPSVRRAGLGRALLSAFESEAAERGAARAFLEVAAGNTAAVALYRSAGYRESGRRRGYYRLENGQREDALIMEKPLGLA